MKIYIVVCGEYSDKWNAAAFTNEEYALAYAAVEDGYVELDQPLNEKDERIRQRSEYIYHVRMLINDSGNLNATSYKAFLSEGDVLVASVLARSSEHAIKIINDQRSAWLAGGKRLGTPNNYGWAEILF